ncbi:hypothetical protein SBF1_1800002 [Candidatus Desulfosporosinus infrequens]|uniref:Uncharacterized protein n=1 Tax=Candidatus Desulfosporosinus infrequens TaxID=2043169 RepID=A0A2U3KCQ7_9FIRM|nr:hypothetical protein SBF1_1800002 [Candidatus Desulfosporosinus infrequens]
MQGLSKVIITETAMDKRRILGLEEKATMFVEAQPELNGAGIISETDKKIK